jgi:recombination protein RecA
MAAKKRQQKVRLRGETPSVFQKEVTFLSTGCAALDAIMGGGYAFGRTVNIVGDRSTGKTLLLIEACANLVLQFPRAHIRYIEAESAFDKQYAKALGLPLSRVEFEEDVETVEELFLDLETVVNKRLKAQADGKPLAPMLYCVDSLDAIGDKAESERSIDKNSMGMGKPKKMSEMFRKLVRKLTRAKVLVIIISQTRDKIGITFGKRQTRSGGKALDFYASQILWLSEVKKNYRTVKKVKRPVSVLVRARMEKNKVGLPFRECTFPIVFNFGIDDVEANLTYLAELNSLHKAGLRSQVAAKKLLAQAKRMKGDELQELRASLRKAVMEAYQEVETSFLPKRQKYGP